MSSETEELSFKFQYRFFLAVAKFISLSPKLFLNLLKATLSFFMILFWGKDRRLIERNLMKVYQLPSHSNFTKSFVRQVARHQAAAMVETLSFAVGGSAKVKVDHLDELSKTVDALLEQGKGLIIITAHIGSWELVARSIAQVTGQTFNALAKPSKLAAFTAFLNDLREHMNIKVLWTDRKDLLRAMISILRKGEILGFVMDQKPEGRRGPVVSFMGQQSEFVSGPSRIALKTKAPILAVYALRNGPWSYRVLFEQIHCAQDDELALTQKMATSMERVIRSYPDQWLWNYKRWRS